MNDILPDEAERWEAFETIVRDWLRGYGYRPIRMPLLEHTPLFKRAIGEVTDIVEKEMYSFEDALNGENLTLRPEGTASCVRAVTEHNLLYDSPRKLWYMGPMFRHERPQKGRYRQFHQVGVEALGYGSPEERLKHRAELIAYFEAHQSQLDEDAKRRLHSNPLRILDTKNPAMQALVEAAPKLSDYLGEESLAHFTAIQDTLRAANIPFRINPRLVRGLDYYNLTVFEWVTDQLGAQGTVCAGGRYDGLIAQLGGKPAPAAGFAMGIERLMALWDAKQADALVDRVDVYIAHSGAGTQAAAFTLAERLRDGGFATLMHCGGGSFKSQMKRADASGAMVALILGEDEVAAGEVTFKPLRGGEQMRVSLDDVGEHLAAMLLDDLVGDNDDTFQ